MEASLHYVRILTDSYNKMWHFYVDKLNFKPTLGFENGIYEEFEIGSSGSILSIYNRKHMESALGIKMEIHSTQQNCKVLISLLVNDVDSEYKYLKNMGINFVCPPTDRMQWLTRTAHFKDPDGNLIELYEPLRK